MQIIPAEFTPSANKWGYICNINKTMEYIVSYITEFGIEKTKLSINELVEFIDKFDIVSIEEAS